jgi:hypothetical protein
LTTKDDAATVLFPMNMWNISFHHDPLSYSELDEKDVWSGLGAIDSILLHSSISIDKLLNERGASEDDLVAFRLGGKLSKTTLSHLISRTVENFNVYKEVNEGGICQTTIEPLHMMRISMELKRGSRHKRIASKRKISSKRKLSELLPPYILERTDIYCDDDELHLTLAVIIDTTSANEKLSSVTISKYVQGSVHNILSKLLHQVPTMEDIMANVANTVLQEKIREELPSMNAIAFLANGSIIPRKSGASYLPMASPPAIPLIAPENSHMTREISIDVGCFFKYIKNVNIRKEQNGLNIVKIRGLVVPKGITLIVGGGYHGKSTMLRAIMTGVYNKHLGDGRELCVTDASAVSVRAEDGRYVPKPTNISAFISNLPFGNSDTTRYFSSNEASGSTSQAANVAEAIEMKSRVILVDEDLAAANFMSRDGRMRALVMDESITPLLYRVNGLFQKHGVSSVVVVGGVGDWLDVPNAVIMLNKYVISDALQKAKSISAQFSHGHVQYAGRGVVHRLPWDSDGTPYRRRPTDITSLVGKIEQCILSLMDGGGRLKITPLEPHYQADGEIDSYNLDDDFGDCHDEEKGIIDMSRCEQLLGGNSQLFGCGICVLWILKHSMVHQDLDINELLDALEKVMDDSNGIQGIIKSMVECTDFTRSSMYHTLIEFTGHAYRPRRYEVSQALTRIRGISFHELPTEVDEEDLKSKKEAEERKRALAELWANRRKKE